LHVVYRVDEKDERLICQVLERMGKAMWRSPAGMRYLFRLQSNGTIWADAMGLDEVEPLALDLPTAERSHLSGYTLGDLRSCLREARALATAVVLMEEFTQRGEAWPADLVARFLPPQGANRDEWSQASPVDKVRFVELVAEQPDRLRRLNEGLGLALEQEKDPAVALAIIDLLTRLDDRDSAEHLRNRRELLDRRPDDVDRLVELAVLDEALAQLDGGSP
jgi:hypothetical protein